MKESASLSYAGITELPAAAKSEESYPERILQERENIYSFVRQEIMRRFNRVIAYYPASGSDPIPLKIFGQDIIYGSLPDRPYIRWLKDARGHLPLSYKNRIRRQGPQPDLQAVLADINCPPFNNNQFNLIVVHDLPADLIANKNVIQKLYDLLCPGGIFVAEGYAWLTTLEILYDNISQGRFRQCSKLNELEQLMNFKYFADGLPTSNLEFMQLLKRRPSRKGLTMFAYQLRVFEKSEKTE